MKSKIKHILWTALHLVLLLSVFGVVDLRAQQDLCPLPSNVLAINVNAEPVANITGGNVIICSAGYVTLLASLAVGPDPLGWQWQMSVDSMAWNNIAGATTTTYITPLLMDTIWYRVRVETGSSGCDIVFSEPTWVKVVSDPAIQITGGTAVCTGGSANLQATQSGGVGGCQVFWEQSTDSGTTWSLIAGATNNSYTAQNLTQTTQYRAGKACAGLGCDTAFSNIEIVQMAGQISVSASSNSPVCMGESLLLQASGGNSYSWSAADGFASSQQNPSRSSAQTGMSGTYNVTVTDANGCTATASAQVLVKICDEICDNNIDDDGDGAIDCADTECAVASFDLTANGPTSFCEGGSVVLSASGSGPFAWSTGAITNSITATQSGNYSVSVTNTSGCSLVRTLSVTKHSLPAATANVTGQPCSGGEVTLTATGGKYYEWTGPNGFSSHWNTLTINHLDAAIGGIYSVKITSPAGCTATAFTAIAVGLVPGGLTASGGLISCSNPTVILGNSGGQNLDYQWTGPAGFSSSSLAPAVSQAGVYELLATDPANGCQFRDTAIVTRVDTAFSASATVSGTINCITESVMLEANSSLAAPVIAWSGPNGFSSNARNPMAALPGTYNLTLTNPETGCTAAQTVTVLEDKAMPTGSVLGGNLSCGVLSAQLSVTPDQPGMLFRWTGPGGFASTAQTPVVQQSGTYHVQIIDPANGCGSLVLETDVIIQ